MIVSSIVRGGNHFIRMKGHWRYPDGMWLLIDGPWYEHLMQSYDPQHIRQAVLTSLVKPLGFGELSASEVPLFVEATKVVWLPVEWSISRLVWRTRRQPWWLRLLNWPRKHKPFDVPAYGTARYEKFEQANLARRHLGWYVEPDGKLPAMFNAVEWESWLEPFVK